MKLDYCSLLSSGKDSNYAMLWAFLHGFKLICTIAFNTQREDSWMLQTINTELAKLQAKAVGTKHYSFYIEGEKEKEIAEIEQALRKVLAEESFRYITTGALRSDYQRIRFEYIFRRMKIRSINPLWWMDQYIYLKRLLELGMEFVITRVSAYGFPVHLIGKIIEPSDLEKIYDAARKYGFNPAFEGGEAETLVVFSPIYKKRICFNGKIVRKGYVYELAIEDYWLEDPSNVNCYHVYSA